MCVLLNLHCKQRVPITKFDFDIYKADIKTSIIMLLIKLFRIGPVTGPRLAVLDRGRRPRSNTADQGPVTGPIRNNLINEIFIN